MLNRNDNKLTFLHLSSIKTVIKHILMGDLLLFPLKKNDFSFFNTTSNDFGLFYKLFLLFYDWFSFKNHRVLYIHKIPGIQYRQPNVRLKTSNKLVGF